MADPMEVSLSVEQSLDRHALRSRVRELEDVQRRLEDDEVSEPSTSDSDKLLKDCVLDVESRIQQIASEFSDAASFLGIEDLDSYVEHLKEELVKVKAESTHISSEIEALQRNHVENSNRLKTDLEELKSSLDHFAAQVPPEEAIVGAHGGCSKHGEDQSNMIHVHRENKIEMVELDHEIEKKKKVLKSLEDLDHRLKSFEVMEEIEDAFGGLKVIEVSQGSIRLSLRTHIPKLEESLNGQRTEDIIEPSELSHELLIEVLEGRIELKSVEIFPSDVYINDIVDASKSFSDSPLEWFVRKVQERIILCTLRQYVVDKANKSRHFFEYLNTDETIVCHMVGGIDAFIKLSQGWPLSNSPLKLMSLKSVNHHSKDYSLTFICKVEEVANSLDVQIRRHLSSFVDAVENILKEQMRLEILSDGTSDK